MTLENIMRKLGQSHLEREILLRKLGHSDLENIRVKKLGHSDLERNLACID